MTSNAALVALLRESLPLWAVKINDTVLVFLSKMFHYINLPLILFYLLIVTSVGYIKLPHFLI